MKLGGLYAKPRNMNCASFDDIPEASFHRA
jgi:hypothetical protein